MTHVRRRGARGMILLEVMVALAILGFGIASTAAVAVASLDSVRRAQREERAVQRAAALLNAVALWPRADLDLHLGTRVEGEMLLRIDRPNDALYDVSIDDSAGRATLLQTALYRRVAIDAIK